MVNRVVITGIGVISSIGVGKDPFWEGCIQGRDGIAPISGFDVSHLRSKLGGQVPDIDFKEYIKRANPSKVCFTAKSTAALRNFALQ